MNIIERAAQYYTPVSWTRRPIVAGVLHDTETRGQVPPHSQGSWHYEIDRDGTVYRDVLERHCAWHVFATDRWRPTWIVPSPINLSDANWCTLGIELVSHTDYRDTGEPYTNEQYEALRELLAEIHSRYPTIPWVGHGELQRDRTDPVAFDWERAGFDGPVDGDGRYWRLGTPDVGGTEEGKMILTGAEAALVDLHRAIGITRDGVELLVSRNGRTTELGEELTMLGEELRDSRRMPTRRRKAIGALVAAHGGELAAYED